jgi:hypothetical protein
MVVGAGASASTARQRGDELPDAHVLDQQAHNGRLVRVGIAGKGRQEHLFLCPEVRARLLGPEGQERAGYGQEFLRGGRAETRRPHQPARLNQALMMIRRERLQGRVPFHRWLSCNS